MLSGPVRDTRDCFGKFAFFWHNHRTKHTTCNTGHKRSKMGGIKFSCGTNASLCFHSDATCLEFGTAGNERETCLCPDGFQFDLTGARNLNCALPTWFLPAFFAISTLGTMFGLYNLRPHELWSLRGARRTTSLRGEPRVIAILFTLAMLAQWLDVLCVFAQAGMFEGGAFVQSCASALLHYTTYRTIFALVTPMYAALRRPIHKFRLLMRCVSGGIATGVLIASGGGMVAYCRTDFETFNVFYATYLFLAGLGYTIPGTVMYIQSWRLERMIRELSLQNNQTSADKMVQFLKQLAALRKITIRLLFNSVIITLPVVLIIIGSIPYNFVFWAILYSSLWPMSRNAAKFTRVTDSTTISTVEDNSSAKAASGAQVSGALISPATPQTTNDTS